jgi:ABC-2 type transport system permease protein
MNKILIVGWREFLVTIRTRTFLLSVVLMPGLIIGSMYGSRWIERKSREEKSEPRRIAVVDQTGVVYPEFARQVEGFNADLPNQPLVLHQEAPESADLDALAKRIDRGELYGYVVLRPEVLELGGGGCDIARKDNQLRTGRRLEEMVSEAVFAVRCHQAGLDPRQVQAMRVPVAVQWLNIQTGKQVAVNPFLQFMTPFAFMFLLFMGTFVIAQGLLTSLLEEKSTRVIEVLLSAVNPTQLLAGKILGLALVGLVVLAVWCVVGYIAAQRFQAAELVSGFRIGIALVYFIPGFLLMASILAAIGSACNDIKDAQSMTFPLSMLTIVPMIFWYYLVEHPQAMMSHVLSYIPPITPFVMVLRSCADPQIPLWQILSTLAVLWAAVFVTMWAAGRIFRIGVLMYGKAPTPMEMLRWVRTP